MCPNPCLVISPLLRRRSLLSVFLPSGVGGLGGLAPSGPGSLSNLPNVASLAPLINSIASGGMIGGTGSNPALDQRSFASMQQQSNQAPSSVPPMGGLSSAYSNLTR